MLDDFEVELISVDGAALWLAFDLTHVVPLVTVFFFSGFVYAGTSVAGGVPSAYGVPGSAAVVVSELCMHVDVESVGAVVVSELGMHVDVKSVGAMHAGG